MALVPTRVVVSEREREHDGEPKNRTDDDQLSAFGTIAGVHEVENNERGLDRGDGQRDDNIEFTKVLKCRPNGDAGAGHQRRKDGHVNLRRNNVLGHARLSGNSPTGAYQSDITTGTNRSTQYRQSASKGPRFLRACCTAG